MWSSRAALALLVLQPIAFFWHVLVNPKSHIPWDIQGFHYPLLAAIARTLRQGEWPWWNSLIYSGYPIHADVQAQLFYPPAWIPILVRNLTGRDNILYSLQWMVVLHMALAGLLMFRLVRRLDGSVPAALFAGTVFELGAFFASQIQHVGAVCGAAWLPLAWLAAYELRERFSWRWISALAAALALSFLSGFLAITIVVYLSAGLFTLGLVILRLGSLRLLAHFTLSVACSVGLVAVQLWPALQLADRSFAKLRASWGAGLGGIPIQAWWGLLWPDALGLFTPFDRTRYTLPYNFTFLWLYCGLAVILLAFLVILRGDRRMRLFLALAAFSLLMGSGDHIPGLRPLFELAPANFRGAMYVEFFPAALSAALAAMGGLALSHFVPDRLAWLVCLFTMIELHWAGSRRPMNTSEGGWKAGSTESRIDGSRPLVDQLRQRLYSTDPPSRLDMLDLITHFSMSAPLRPLPVAGGDSPFAPLDVLEVRRSYAGGNYWERAIPVAKPESPWLDFLNVEYLIAEKQPEDAAALARAGWSPVEGGEWMRLYRNSQVQPRCFAAPRIHPVRDSNEARKALAAVDVRQEIVVEAPLAPHVAPAQVHIAAYRDNRVELQVRAAAPAFVVCSDTWYPGWHASIDGRDTPLYRANLAFRGVAVPAGEHHITFSYSPTRLLPGALVTFTTLLLLAVLSRRAG